MKIKYIDTSNHLKYNDSTDLTSVNRNQVDRVYTKMKNANVGKFTDDEMSYFLSSIMDAGELLLMHGAEVSRVEDTIVRLCRTYGFVRSDVFTITSSIVVTAMISDGMAITQTRRIKVRDTDFGKVEKLNALSRRVCENPLSLQQFQRELRSIRDAKKAPAYMELIMYMLISASLSVFFGGNCMDGFAAAISGMILYATLYGSAGLELNNIIQNMICSAITAAAVLLLVKAGIGEHMDKITIGNIMLVIPGIQLTNSLRDMINGDTISGLLNMSEALLKAIAVAMGFAIVLILGG
jgi:uncharacterized membrane protein YjjP (DUF1212 family)